VQKRNAAFEVAAPRFLSAVSCQRAVKERFENVIKEVLVSAIFALRQTAEKIVSASAPILTLGHAKPALLLEEVEKHYLAHELLGEIHSANAFCLEFLPNDGVFSSKFRE